MSAPQTFRSLDASGDWVFGGGKSSYCSGNTAIQNDIKTALQIFMGECFWDTSFGVDWWNLLGGKNPSAQASIILQVRTVILGVSGVTQINSVSVSQNSTSRSLSIQYNINTIFTQSVTGAVSTA
jgi:hypothetical protein